MPRHSPVLQAGLHLPSQERQKQHPPRHLPPGKPSSPGGSAFAATLGTRHRLWLFRADASPKCPGTLELNSPRDLAMGRQQNLQPTPNLSSVLSSTLTAASFMVSQPPVSSPSHLPHLTSLLPGGYPETQVPLLTLHPKAHVRQHLPLSYGFLCLSTPITQTFRLLLIPF